MKQTRPLTLTERVFWSGRGKRRPVRSGRRGGFNPRAWDKTPSRERLPDIIVCRDSWDRIYPTSNF